MDLFAHFKKSANEPAEPRPERMEIPLCMSPWLYLGLGWGNYSVCCNSYPMDFGKITESAGVQDWNKEIFNAPSYIAMRKSLVEGRLTEYCKVCPGKGLGSSGIHQTVEQYASLLLQIEDDAQRQRAKNNFAAAIEAAVTGRVEVAHDPCFLNITCGSACNIRCKFCYNCLMDYHPKAEDLLRVIDQVHENLTFVQLTGGEPLITPAGRAILREFAAGEYKFAVRIGTNAQWTDFDLLRPVNLAEVQISSDGATKETYEKIRIGGNFEDLISNIKKFVELRREKPYMVIRLNYTVTSDNYMDIPEAVKLYEEMGLFITFNLVMREKDDPQNIKERPDLYEDFLKCVEEGIRVSRFALTQDCLKNIKSMIEEKMTT